MFAYSCLELEVLLLGFFLPRLQAFQLNKNSQFVAEANLINQLYVITFFRRAETVEVAYICTEQVYISKQLHLHTCCEWGAKELLCSGLSVREVLL